MLTEKRIPAEKRKRMIIRAAIDVFSESNYRVAKVSDIAERAGITDPMIYKFFKSKSELFQEILITTSEQTIVKFFTREFFQPENLQTKDDYIVTIEKSLWAYFNNMEQFQKELKVYYQAISEVDESDVRKVLRDSYQNYASIYESILQKGTDDGLLHLTMDVRTIAWDIVGFTIQQSTLFIIGFYDVQDMQTLLRKRIQTWIP
ncbi:TetR/AcrR family transcriptional regulator [Solibacillus sp. FSL H8-0538]|uniref:TetR/AcrR family transcriptional regulator n=1 Tax=Solibacillus sp. FSL H8-0538 TaxID=2921400 RepID=UPI0030F72C3B